MFGSPTWLRLPSGRLINMNTVAMVDPHGLDQADVIFAVPATPTDADYDPAPGLVARTFIDEDALALLAYFQAHAVVIAPTPDNLDDE